MFVILYQTEYVPKLQIRIKNLIDAVLLDAGCAFNGTYIIFFQ